MFDPSPGMAELLASFETFNALQIRHLQGESGLRYLGPDGPVFLASVRIRGTFIDPTGGHWADARLVVESAFLGTSAWEYFSNELGGLLADESLDLWIADRNRGIADAILAPIGTIAEVLGLPEPERFPDGWARDWTTLPTVTDDSMLALMAAGWGEPPSIWDTTTEGEPV